MGARLEQLKQWLGGAVGLPPFALEPASGDASFRRYFRVTYDGQSVIAVDAPPAQEDNRPFVRVARQLRGWGLNAPEILAEEPELGFLLVSDLGTELYREHLDETRVERLYGDALSALLVMQLRGAEVRETLPPYDEALLLQEMALFRDWYLGRHLQLELTGSQHEVIEAAYRLLVANALSQPQVFVHRDYHSRNLLHTPVNNPGILDFQDAVWGPVTYDLVSLLRDCYIAWPRERVEEWALGYQNLAHQSGVLRQFDELRFLRWFDLMGVQRHLKASGIFARLNYRDGKPNYLQDIPRTLGYVADVASRYPELCALHELLSTLGALPE
ncbi:MAG: aminoglycoside phosphotransferase [Proteobacteria bacterium]|nr:MAG: aminoglycoside phosphotransferase [Pseudomonadota bacterium]